MATEHQISSLNQAIEQCNTIEIFERVKGALCNTDTPEKSEQAIVAIITACESWCDVNGSPRMFESLVECREDLEEVTGNREEG